jgi:hypothetical protein
VDFSTEGAELRDLADIFISFPDKRLGFQPSGTRSPLRFVMASGAVPGYRPFPKARNGHVT